MTYKPTEFIGLQYHLHIPGPDPLTNNDTEERQKYYGSAIRGTPSTFFNGKDEAGGGGRMAAPRTNMRNFARSSTRSSRRQKRRDHVVRDSRRRPDQDRRLRPGQRGTGSEAKGQPMRKPKEGEVQAGLRLALTEESIRYVGGNKLRFHHHVVRAFPGRPRRQRPHRRERRGRMTLNLGDLKRKLETYLSDFAKTGPFPTRCPRSSSRTSPSSPSFRTTLIKASLVPCRYQLNRVNP